MRHPMGQHHPPSLATVVPEAAEAEAAATAAAEAAVAAAAAAVAAAVQSLLHLQCTPLLNTSPRVTSHIIHHQAPQVHQANQPLEKGWV